MIELGFQDIFFEDIKNGKKTVIGKINTDLPGIKKGSTVIFFKDVGNNANSSEKISVKVKDIHKFNDLMSMLKEMKLKTILPRSKTYKDGEKVFETNYGNRLKDAKFISFTFDIIDNTGPRIKNKKNDETNGETNGKTNEIKIHRGSKAPPGFVLRASASNNGRGEILDFQPINDAKLHMQERHERYNKPWMNHKNMHKSHKTLHIGPRIKDKKNGESNGPRTKNKNNFANEDEDEDEDENDENYIEPNGPRIKNKKNGENNGPRIKNKNLDLLNLENLHNGPRVKDKKNGDSNGPRVKDKKNGNAPNSNRPPRDFELIVREPWFSLIENGQKQVEARLFRGIVEEFRVNDTIHFINKMNNKEKTISAKITKLKKYPNFKDLLFHEELYKVLPGYPDIKCGNVLFEKIYKNINLIREFGALAIGIKVI